MSFLDAALSSASHDEEMIRLVWVLKCPIFEIILTKNFEDLIFLTLKLRMNVRMYWSSLKSRIRYKPFHESAIVAFAKGHLNELVKLS